MSERRNHTIKLVFIVILIFVVVIFAILGAGFFYYQHNENEIEKRIQEIYSMNEESLIEFNDKIEYGYEISYNELVNKLIDVDKLQENTKIKILINDQEILSDGTYKFNTVENLKIRVELSYTYNYKMLVDLSKTIENSKETEIIVEDTKMPVISGVSNKEITVGDEINLLEGITAQDEIDGELEVTVEGNVDNTKAGEYTIKVSATDKNGNITEQEYKVTVKEKPVAKTNPSTTSKSNTNSSTKKNTSNNSLTSSSSNSNKNNNSGSSSGASDASTKQGRLKIAQSEAKKVAAKIFKPGMTDLEKAQAIAEYLYTNVDRQLNQSTEAYKTNYGNEAYAAFVLKIAACSGFCKAAVMLCQEAGIQCKHINANQWTHQWLEVYIDDRWVEMDPQLGAVFY